MNKASRLLLLFVTLSQVVLLASLSGRRSVGSYALCLDEASEYMSICIDGILNSHDPAILTVDACGVVYDANEAECGSETNSGWLSIKNPHIPHLEDWLKTHPQYSSVSEESKPVGPK